MAIEVQYRFGTTADIATKAGGPQEIVVDTTKNTLVVMDGIQAGGFPLAKENLSNVPTFVGASSGSGGATGKIPVPAAGDQNKYLAGDATWKSLPTLQIVTVSTTSYNLSLSDTDNYLRFTFDGTKSLVVPTNASVAFPIGTSIAGISATAGQLTISATGGVTINTPETLRLRDRQYVSFVLTKVGTDEWDLAGDLEAL
jgi:hypothetical protein